MLLKYSVGFQAGWSDFSIYDDGTIKKNVSLPLGQRIGTVTMYLGSKAILLRSIARYTPNTGDVSSNDIDIVKKIEAMVKPYIENVL